MHESATPTATVAHPQRFLEVLKGSALTPPPMWLMRQAGRYLPEYRAVREKAGSFLNLCYNPALAAEVTLQPIRRYGFDAAILFSDILVIPDALGQEVRFVEGEGPRLDPIRNAADLTRLKRGDSDGKLDRVLETVARLRQDLPRETALIGFCGAPWTVATYMVAGRGSPDQADARMFAYSDPAGFARLIDIVTEASISYLDGQVRAGAGALQIFDTWAGVLPDSELERWVLAPTRRIVKEVKQRHPGVPIIGFPRGIGAGARHYRHATRIDALSCDTAMPLAEMRALAGNGTAVQGNLDPLLLVAGGPILETRVRETLEAMKGVPFIFNLGHGIVPQTPPENVAKLVELVRAPAAGG